MKKTFPTIAALAFATGAVLGAYALAMIMEKLEGEIKEGDYIQWTSNGKDMFTEPKRVSKVMTSEFGTYLMVDGSRTGIPLSEATKVSPMLAAT
jgi:hypothetical protein